MYSVDRRLSRDGALAGLPSRHTLLSRPQARWIQSAPRPLKRLPRTRACRRTLHSLPVSEGKLASAEQPARRQLSALSHLTTQTAPFGAWEVLVCQPERESRKHIYNKPQRVSHNFRCLLVSTQDPTQYVLAENHGRGMTEFHEQQTNCRKKRWVPGLRRPALLGFLGPDSLVPWFLGCQACAGRRCSGS